MNKIADMNLKINAIFDADLPPVLLEFNSVFKEVNRINSLWKDIKDLSEIEYPIVVERNSVDIEYQQFDEFLKSSNTEKIKNIKRNLHIIEAVNIINDLKK
jgi:carboxyl-terminal processing protease